METLFLVILGLTMGLVFGIALEKSRVMEPGVLVGQFQFRNFTMLKMFLAATATGLVVLAVMNGAFGVPLHPKAFAIGPVIIGGILLGIGIVIAGACPGTALAQIGAGYRDAWAVVAGGIAGAMFYGYNEGWIGDLVAMGDLGKVTFADYLALPFWALALIVAAILVAMMIGLERLTSWRTDLDKADVPAGDKPGSISSHPVAAE